MRAQGMLIILICFTSSYCVLVYFHSYYCAITLLVLVLKLLEFTDMSCPLGDSNQVFRPA